jgi:hypothetical protein
MTRKHRKNKKGGFLGMDTSSWTSGWSSSSFSPSGWFGKKEQQPAQPQPQPQQPSYGTEPQPSYGAQPQSSYGMGSYGMGGKKRRTRRGKRGGAFSPNMSQTNLAASASPVSGIQTVKAQTWVGGRTKKRRHRHTKSCKHKK